jgi:hypothetical protein
MELNEIVRYSLSAIGGGALASFLTFRVSLKKQKLTEFEVLINEYKDLHDNLSDRVQALENELHQLKIVEIKQREEIISLKELTIKQDAKLRKYEGER